MMSLTNSTGQLLDFIQFHNHINLWTTAQKLACNNSQLAARDLTALRHLATTRQRIRRSSLSGDEHFSAFISRPLQFPLSFYQLLFPRGLPRVFISIRLTIYHKSINTLHTLLHFTVTYTSRLRVPLPCTVYDLSQIKPQKHLSMYINNMGYQSKFHFLRILKHFYSIAVS